MNWEEFGRKLRDVIKAPSRNFPGGITDLISRQESDICIVTSIIDALLALNVTCIHSFAQMFCGLQWMV
jgi:hypothetical protein